MVTDWVTAILASLRGFNFLFLQDEIDAWLRLATEPNKNILSGLSNVNKGFRLETVKPTLAPTG